MSVLLPFQFAATTIIKQGRTTRASVDIIKSWLSQTSLPQLQEEFITLFLLSCMNNINETKKTIQAYMKTKNAAPQIYNTCDLESAELKKVASMMGVAVIPKRMEGNTGIVLTRLEDPNYRNVDVVAIMKVCTMLTHLIQIRDPPDSIILIVDMKGVGFMHLTCIKMKAMIQNLAYVQEGMPLRVKEIHIFNTNFILDRVMSVFKVFIKSELLGNLKAHPPGMDFEEFHKKHISADFLPADYGGKLPSVKEMTEKALDELREEQGFFKAEEELRKSCGTKY